MQTQIDALNQPIPDALASYQRKAPHPWTEEVGLRAPGLDSGIHCRQDGVVEIHAGSARILLDPKSGTVAFLGTSIVGITQDANFQTSKGRFAIGSHPLNPNWITPADNEQPDSDEAKNYPTSPIYQTDPDSLDDAYVYSGPTDESPLVPLSTYLASRRLFLDPPAKDPSADILAQAVDE
jgi:hypothetical protein